MRNPLRALMRIEDRWFDAAQRRGRRRRVDPVQGALVGGAVMLIAGLAFWLFAGFRSAEAPLLLAAMWAVWAAYLAILRRMVRGRHRT
jgi:hypothetical protein